MIALGQSGDGLAVEGLFAGRNDDVVGDQIVDKGKSEPAGMTQPIHLDRAGTEYHDRGARGLHVPIEINQYVDAEIADSPRHLEMGQIAELVIEVDAMPMALVVDGIAAAPALSRDRMDLESLPIVQREELQGHVAHRVIGKIRRHIGNSNAPAGGTGIGGR